MNKTVDMKWQTEGNLAVLYQIDNILLFYSKENDPLFKSEQEVSLKKVQATDFYKAVEYSKHSIPVDAFIDMTFIWA